MPKRPAPLLSALLADELVTGGRACYCCCRWRRGGRRGASWAAAADCASAAGLRLSEARGSRRCHCGRRAHWTVTVPVAVTDAGLEPPPWPTLRPRLWSSAFTAPSRCSGSRRAGGVSAGAVLRQPSLHPGVDSAAVVALQSAVRQLIALSLDDTKIIAQLEENAWRRARLTGGGDRAAAAERRFGGDSSAAQPADHSIRRAVRWQGSGPVQAR